MVGEGGEDRAGVVEIWNRVEMLWVWENRFI